MYGELDIFESHDDQFQHDGSTELSNLNSWIDEQEGWDTPEEQAEPIDEEIPY